ncbi:protein of unknown function [Modestobacter italicus]|uniref:Uncharacterized protein n=1 Tax=Modestobacter italicus (strain DSM 44449 / CECT 9708 / BC 501) TaxID=2732864 RepID=I4F350_MODI5|nr:protein of unknown function [Modestobacter marinus]
MDLSDIDLTTEVVRTERLVLRPFRPDDVDAVFTACQDPDIGRWIPGGRDLLQPRGRRLLGHPRGPGRARGRDRADGGDRGRRPPRRFDGRAPDRATPARPGGRLLDRPAGAGARLCGRGGARDGRVGDRTGRAAGVPGRGRGEHRVPARRPEGRVPPGGRAALLPPLPGRRPR